MGDPVEAGGGPSGAWGLEGRRFVVTGGTRGLGEQIVRHLLAANALATCARDQDGLDALIRSAPSGGARLFTRSLDVTEPTALEEFVEAAASRFDGLDGVVACAGGARGQGLEAATPQDWTDTYALNVGHSARLAASAAPHLRSSGGGSIVFVASISGWKAAPQSQYGAAKAAQILLAASLARELGPDAIRVNAVSPGSMLITGKRWDRLRRDDPQVFERFIQELPGRALVSPREVAQVVTFLLSDISSGISGANVPVDRAQNAPTPDGY